MIDIPVLFEDSCMFALSKPAGVVVNRADSVKGETVQDFVERYFDIDFREDNGDFAARSGVVHRLDKETSGVLLGAKHADCFADLQKQFKEKKIKKTYRALCHGRVFPETGEIHVPVGRLPWNRMRFGVMPAGRDALTRYTVLQYGKLPEKQKRIVTYVEAYPETGRTHQIRIHFQYQGNPIVGDKLYAGRKNVRLDKHHVSRHFLHAYSITFHHPREKKDKSIISPLPSEFSELINLLQ